MKSENMENLVYRCSAIKSAMKEKNVDMLLVVKEENKKYLSMFESTSYTLILTAEKNYIVTDFRYIEAASSLKPLYEVIKTDAKYGLFEFLQDIYKGNLKLGIESDIISLSFAEKLKNVLPHANLIKSDGMVEKLRAVKDKSEMENIANAERIGDEAFSYILDYIKPGITEREISFKLEMKMRELGAEALSFDTICVSGERTSLPHGRPSDKQIEKGDFVTMDFGCVYNGYCSDMTRTVAVGNINDEQRELYYLVLKAQLAACDGIRAGMTGKEADALSRDIISAAGYGEYFGHGLGHGVDLRGKGRLVRAESTEGSLSGPPSRAHPSH